MLPSDFSAITLMLSANYLSAGVVGEPSCFSRMYSIVVREGKRISCSENYLHGDWNLSVLTVQLHSFQHSTSWLPVFPWSACCGHGLEGDHSSMGSWSYHYDIHLMQQCTQVRFWHPNSVGRHKVSIQMIHKIFVSVLCASGSAILGEKKESGAIVLSLDINSASVLNLVLPNFLFPVLPPPVWRILQCWQIYGS